jgi:hypothetical protein
LFIRTFVRLVTPCRRSQIQSHRGERSTHRFHGQVSIRSAGKRQHVFRDRMGAAVWSAGLSDRRQRPEGGSSPPYPVRRTEQPACTAAAFSPLSRTSVFVLTYPSPRRDQNCVVKVERPSGARKREERLLRSAPIINEGLSAGSPVSQEHTGVPVPRSGRRERDVASRSADAA